MKVKVKRTYTLILCTLCWGNKLIKGDKCPRCLGIGKIEDRKRTKEELQRVVRYILYADKSY